MAEPGQRERKRKPWQHGRCFLFSLHLIACILLAKSSASEFALRNKRNCVLLTRLSPELMFFYVSVHLLSAQQCEMSSSPPHKPFSLSRRRHFGIIWEALLRGCLLQDTIPVFSHADKPAILQPVVLIVFRDTNRGKIVKRLRTQETGVKPVPKTEPWKAASPSGYRRVLPPIWFHGGMKASRLIMCFLLS